MHSVVVGKTPEMPRQYNKGQWVVNVDKGQDDVDNIEMDTFWDSSGECRDGTGSAAFGRPTN